MQKNTNNSNIRNKHLRFNSLVFGYLAVLFPELLFMHLNIIDYTNYYLIIIGVKSILMFSIYFLSIKYILGDDYFNNNVDIKNIRIAIVSLLIFFGVFFITLIELKILLS